MLSQVLTILVSYDLILQLGLVAGGVVLLIALTVALRCYCRRRRMRGKKRKGPKENIEATKSKGGKDNGEELAEISEAESGLLHGKAPTPESTPVKNKAFLSESGSASDSDSDKGKKLSPGPAKTDFRQPSFLDDEVNVAAHIQSLHEQEVEGNPKWDETDSEVDENISPDPSESQ